MSLDQMGEGQPEVKSYDQQMQDDVRAAFTEVTSRPVDTPIEKAAPVEQQSAETRTIEQRARDEQGRFAKTEDKKAPPTQKTEEDALAASAATGVTHVAKPSIDKTQHALTPEQLSAQAVPKMGMPPGMSVKAISKWDRFPQEAREEIASFAAKAVPPDLMPFLDRAKQSGQSLAQALNAYTGMEALIKRDPAGGMMHVAQNLGLTQHQAGQLFADLAQRLGVMPNHASQSAASNGLDAQQEPDPYRALAPVLSPFQQRLDTLENHIRQQHEALQGQRLTSSMSAVEKFRSSPEARYFDNVEKDIANLLDKGVVPRTGDYLTDLKAAYETACWQNPEIRQILIAEQAEKDRAAADAAAKQAADKARQASRSITGSPMPGAMPGTARKANGKSYDEDLQNDVLDAIRQVSGRA